MSRVKVVAFTQPCVEGVQTVGEFIAYAARVSNPANQNNSLTAAKLIKYLTTHEHWSPLEMASVTMEINTTRDIARQILRHRSFSFQEFSQRYADVSALGEMFEFSEARLQDTKNRQNSIKTEDEKLQELWLGAQKTLTQTAKNLYMDALDSGIAKEVARKVLPEGLTKSRLYMAGTVRSWVHYILLRRANGTQLEHQEIALDAEAELIKLIPELEYLFKENNG